MYESIKDPNTGSEYNSLLNNTKRIFSKNNDEKETNKKCVLGWITCIIFGGIALYVFLYHENDGSLISKPESFIADKQEQDRSPFRINHVVKQNIQQAGPSSSSKFTVHPPRSDRYVDAPLSAKYVDSPPEKDLVPPEKDFVPPKNDLVLPKKDLVPPEKDLISQKYLMVDDDDDSNGDTTNNDHHDHNGPNSAKRTKGAVLNRQGYRSNKKVFSSKVNGEDGNHRNENNFNPQPDPSSYKNLERGPRNYLNQKVHYDLPIQEDFNPQPDPPIQEDFNPQPDPPGYQDFHQESDSSVQGNPDSQSEDSSSVEEPTSMLKNKYKRQHW